MTDLATAPETQTVVPAPRRSKSKGKGGSGAGASVPEVSTAPQEPQPMLPLATRTGPRELWRHRYLLKMLVRKELTQRYSRSSLGYAWSYVQPAVSLGIYFLFIGVLLGLTRRVENFPVYIFAGHTIVQLMTETWSAGTRCIRKNKALIKKVYLPRELFPVASMLVSLAHMGPPLVLLFLSATITGWEPSFASLAAFVLAVILAATLGLALGMFFGALNVFLKDVQNLVGIIGMFMRWTAPMLYPWTLVQERYDNAGLPHWLLYVYLWNPVCVSVELFHKAFWLSTVTSDPPLPGDFKLSPLLFERAGFAIGLSLILLFGAYALFNRLQSRFAEEL